jgi:hypothetical protein
LIIAEIDDWRRPATLDGGELDQVKLYHSEVMPARCSNSKFKILLSWGSWGSQVQILSIRLIENHTIRKLCGFLLGMRSGRQAAGDRVCYLLNKEYFASN